MYSASEREETRLKRRKLSLLEKRKRKGHNQTRRILDFVDQRFGAEAPVTRNEVKSTYVDIVMIYNTHTHTQARYISSVNCIL